MNKVKMIVTDMDGTLLNSDHKISFENKISIIEAQKKGIKFVLASGRPLPAMISFSKNLEMEKYGGYIIAYNGAYIVDCKNMEIIYTCNVKREDVIDIFNTAKQNEYNFITYIDEYIYIYNHNKYSQIESELTGMNYKLINNLDDLNLNSISKCMIADEPSIVVELENKLKEKYNNKLFITRSMPYFLEILNKDTDKGKAITYLINELKIDKKYVIGVGDSYNDISLLESVGIPIAVGNAVDELKKIASKIVKPNTQHALQDIIINMEE